MRRISLTVLAVAAALLTAPGTATAAATTACASGTNPFCSDLGAAAYAPGTSTPITTAASPADLAFDLTNSSASHTKDKNRWWKSVTFSFGQDRAHSPVISSDLPDQLIVAGSNAAKTTCTSPYTAAKCPAGYGTALVDLGNGGLLSSGIRTATFGIIDLHNVRTETGSHYDADVIVTFKKSDLAQPTTFTGTFSLAGTISTTGAPGIIMPMSWQQQYSTGVTTGTADVSIDSLHLALLGTATETTAGSTTPATVITTARTCGTDDVVLSATDRAGVTVSHTQPLSVTGCPAVTSLTAAAGQRAGLARITAATTAGARPVSTYYWAFGDGAKAETSSPTVTHEYVAGAPRTVTVIAGDAAGAISSAKTLTLAGTTVTGGQASVTKLSGKVADAVSGNAIAATVRLYRCPSKGTSITGCTIVDTTTASSGAWSFTIARPSSNQQYYVGTDSTTTRIGGLLYVLARPQATITLSAPGTASHTRSFTVSGKVSSPSQVGKPIVIQRLSGKSWVTVKTMTLTSSSTYSKSITLPRGTTYLRAVLPASTTSLAAFSTTKRIVVS